MKQMQFQNGILRWGWAFLLMMASVSLGGEKAAQGESLSVVDPQTKRTLGKLTQVEQNVLKYTNQARQKFNKPPLTAVSHLTVIAQQHAINMARQQSMQHTLDGKGIGGRLQTVSYQFRAYGENIAMGYPNEQETVKGWMRSPGHRKNLLDEDNLGYTQIGIGAHRGPRGRWYYCQVFARPAHGKIYE